jgi:hypothetical protein
MDPTFLAFRNAVNSLLGEPPASAPRPQGTALAGHAPDAVAASSARGSIPPGHGRATTPTHLPGFECLRDDLQTLFGELERATAVKSISGLHRRIRELKRGVSAWAYANSACSEDVQDLQTLVGKIALEHTQLASREQERKGFTKKGSRPAARAGK